MSGSAVLRTTDAASGVGTLTVNRPERLNALDWAALGELAAGFEALDADPGVRVVVLTGAGERAFIAGADVREVRDLSLDAAPAYVAAGQGLTLRMERMTKPVIAAVNGLALGGGLELALAADIRIAADTAELGFPEVRLGMLPAWGGTQRAVRLLGRGLALELVLTGRRVDAAEALRIGLVNRVVPAAQLGAAVAELARTIAANSPAALRQARLAILRGADVSLEEGLAIEAEAALSLLAHGDRLEGLTALLEKRTPRWER